jgi:hypothetical protein
MRVKKTEPEGSRAFIGALLLKVDISWRAGASPTA